MTVACFFSVQKILMVMIAIDLNLQGCIPCSISEPAMKAFVVLKNGTATSAAGFSSVWREQRILELECCERS